MWLLGITVLLHRKVKKHTQIRKNYQDYRIRVRADVLPKIFLGLGFGHQIIWVLGLISKLLGFEFLMKIKARRFFWIIFVIIYYRYFGKPVTIFKIITI